MSPAEPLRIPRQITPRYGCSLLGVSVAPDEMMSTLPADAAGGLRAPRLAVAPPASPATPLSCRGAAAASSRALDMPDDGFKRLIADASREIYATMPIIAQLAHEI